MAKTRAIIIDDNMYNVNVLRQLLELEGVECVSLNVGRDISAQVAEVRSAAVIFLDLELPKLSGYDVFELLKANAKVNRIPVIACTVHTAEINTVFEMGFDGFLGKPLDAETFPEHLSRILSGEKVWYIP